MADLKVTAKLPLGLAWNWVKFSFAIFREKPINFLVFSLTFIIFSFAPFIGSFLNVLIIVRIYLTADKISNSKTVGIKLNLLELLRKKNIIHYGLANALFDVFLMSLLQEILKMLQIDSTSSAMLIDPRVAFVLLCLSLIRVIFFGISLVILTFNPAITFFQALLLSWKFLFHHWVVLIFAIFLLLPFLLVPIYAAGLIVVSVTNGVLFSIALFFLLIFILLFLSVTTIFSYKLYRDGINI